MEKKKSCECFGTETKGFVVFVTFFVVMMLALVICSSHNVFLKKKVQVLNKEGEALKMHLSSLDKEVKELRKGASEKPKDGWKQHFSNPAKTDLIGKTKDEAEDILGAPLILLREATKEVWIYHPYDTDSTALYIYIQEDKVTNGFLDEYNGLGNSEIWLDERFGSKEVAEKKKSKKSLLEYYERRDAWSDQKKTRNFSNRAPKEAGLNEVSRTKVVCPEDAQGACGGDLILVTEEYLHAGEQEFFFVLPGERRYDYYGPFTDNLEAIAQESKLYVIYEEVDNGIVRLKPIAEYNATVKELSFEIVTSGFYSGYKEAGYHRIDTQEKWKELWEKTYAEVEPKPELPEVDFEKNTVLAIFAGEFSGGGYRVEVEKVVDAERSVQVSVKLESPSNSCATTAALTQPFKIIKLEKIKKEVEYQKRRTEKGC